MSHNNVALPAGCALLTLGGGCLGLLLWIGFWMGIFGLAFAALLKYVFDIDVAGWF